MPRPWCDLSRSERRWVVGVQRYVARGFFWPWIVTSRQDHRLASVALGRHEEFTDRRRSGRRRGPSVPRRARPPRTPPPRSDPAKNAQVAVLSKMTLEFSESVRFPRRRADRARRPALREREAARGGPQGHPGRRAPPRRCPPGRSRSPTGSSPRTATPSRGRSPSPTRPSRRRRCGRGRTVDLPAGPRAGGGAFGECSREDRRAR